MAQNQSFNLQINGVNTAITNVSQLQTRLNDLNNQFANAQAGTRTFRDLQTQIAFVNTQIGATQTNVQSLNNTRLTGLRSATQSISAGFGSISSSVTGAVTSTDSLTAATQALGIENQFLTRAIAIFGRTATTSLNSAGTAGSRFGATMKAAMAATGIGLLLVGLAAVITYLTKTQEGTDKLGRKMAFFGGIITGITNALAEMGKGIVTFIEEAIENPMVIVDALIEQAKTRLAGLLNIFTSLAKGDLEGVTNAFGQLTLGVDDVTGKVVEFGKALKKSGEDGEAVKVLEQNFDRLSKSIEIANKQLEVKANYYKTIAADATKSEAERIAALEKQFALEDQIDKNKLKVAQANYKLIKETNALSDSSREDLQKEALALQEIANVKAEIKRGDVEDRKQIAALRRQTTLVNIAASKEELEEQININQEKLASDKLTLAEKDALIRENYRIQKEIIQKNLAELDSLEDNSAAARKARSKQETALKKLEGKEQKELIKLQEEYLKREETALEKINKAKIESRKLDLSLITDNETKKQVLTEVANEELALLKSGYEKKRSEKGLSNAELLALEAEYATQVKAIQTNLSKEVIAIDKDSADKQKETLQALKDAREAEAQGIKDTYTALADVINQTTDALTASALKALEAKMSGIDSIIETAKGKLSELDAQASEVNDRINTLEEALMNSRGQARDKIIKQLELEREKQKQLAAEKTKEDNRIKRAEADKIALEKQKEKAIAKQVIVQQALQGVQAAIAGIEALRAGLAAAKTVAETGAKGKFGWDNIALIIAAGGALVGSMMAVKNAAKGFAEGGFTGHGDKYEEAGVVHKGEYVIPQWMVKKQPSLVTQLESQRLKGYAEGGMVSGSLAAMNTDNGNAELIARIDTQNALLMQNLDKPVYTVPVENQAVLDNVNHIKTIALSN